MSPAAAFTERPRAKVRKARDEVALRVMVAVLFMV
jgi:hypothetical protein